LDADAADGQPDREGGTDGLDAGPALMSEQSFTVAATISFPGPTAQKPPTFTIELMLRLDPVGHRLVVGAPGGARAVRVRPATGSTFETMEPFMIPGSLGGYCGFTITVDKLTIDAGPNGLSAQGTGVANAVTGGDILVRYDAVLSLVGPRDSIGPSLGEDIEGVDPLAALALTASEPVASGATARLVLGGARVQLEGSRAADLIVGFAKPMQVALRYSSTYQVEVDTWSDLAQNAGRALPKLTTQALPELSPEDGFESAGPTLGGAHVVQAPDYPVLAGKKSVLLTPHNLINPRSSRFTVRLARAANDAVVRVTLRPLGVSDSPSTIGVSLRIGVPGGSIVHATLPASESVATPLGAPTLPGLLVGTARTVEIPLPPLIGPEIIFDLANQAPEGCGLFPATAGYLLDDLRID
jgi:hypothetical protein